MSKSFILTKTQLKTLLFGLGYKSVNGQDLGNGQIGDGELIASLNSLMSMGLISSDGTGFTGSVYAKKIARQMSGTTSFTAIHTIDQALPDLCVYSGEELLAVSRLIYNENAFSLRFVSIDELSDDLRDEGYFPEQSPEMNLDEADLEEFEQAVFDRYNPLAPLGRDSHVLFSAELISDSGDSLGCLRLVEYFFYSYIFFSDGNDVKRTILTPEDLREYLKRLLDIK